MSRIMTLGIAALVMAWPGVGQAEPPTATLSSQISGTVACPKRVDGVHIKRIHEYTTPNGWHEDQTASGGYGDASLPVIGHDVSAGGKKLHCFYGLIDGGGHTYMLVATVRNAPGGRTCNKSGNYSFRCGLDQRMKKRLQ